MKAMILAAGMGNRMRPLTLHTPKPLLKVGSKPLIVWHIEKLQAIGVTEIVINTAWLGEKLLAELGDGSQFGVNILWSHEGEGLETAGGIVNALPLLGDEPFILVNGDVWTTADFAGLKTVELADNLAHLLLVSNPPQHPQGDFILSAGRSYLFEQQQSGEALTYSGVAVYSPLMFKGLEQGKRAMLPLFKQAMLQGQISAEKLVGTWVDVGTPERLAELDQQILAGMFD
ncbi:MurNAc alpha-1-phosphate uridylyltransferase [Acinetobacter calcoaceticus]|uniref:MurNAc alpha-1-phosphate uridylyltransferase n=1 Tax=Acinetobacter calcoaceticus TaxID=471 RepID=A0A4V2R089_ACICA|nr:MurNAc alpha-1-phosphate uridylyltransferase [Acinetobacter calcoaceticus]